MDSEGSFVNEEIEVIIKFYEALGVESTPSRESKICESVLKGLTMLFACRLLAYWYIGSGAIGKDSFRQWRLCFYKRNYLPKTNYKE